MAKFRKKPVVIEAELFNAWANDGHGNNPFNVLNYGWPCAEHETHDLIGKHWVQTLEGPLVVSDGDWIIKGVKGEHYPVKPDIFDMTYEPVEHSQGAEAITVTVSVDA